MNVIEDGMNQSPISISVSVSDNYVQHLAVLATSLLYYSPQSSFLFHVLTRAISTKHREALRQMERAHAPRCRFEIHTIEASRFERFPLPLEHISQETYYRFLLPNLLVNETRTLYMDVDIIAKGDVTSLWNYPLDGAAIGAVEEIKNHPDFIAYKEQIGLGATTAYFNAGVLVMDLEQLRAMDFETKAMTLTAKMDKSLAWPDQDVINLLLAGKICPLPAYFNCMKLRWVKDRSQIVLRHYASFGIKPWCYHWRNQFWYSYLRFLLMTPFRRKAWNLVWGHFRGLFWYTYQKKGIKRYMILGLTLFKKRCQIKK